jgi:hypothetical protein
MSFEEAVKSGMQTWQKVNQNGRFNLVDVRQCWVQGVANPELEPMPPDILEKWGVVALVEGVAEQPFAGQGQAAPVVPAATPRPATPQPAVPQPVAPQPSPAIVAGRWTYTVTAADGRLLNGQLKITSKGNQLQMTATASYPMLGPDGQMHQFQEKNDFVGSLSGQTLVAQCNSATYTMDGHQVPPQGLPLQLNLVVSPDGRTMQGQVANAFGFTVPVVMQKQ